MASSKEYLDFILEQLSELDDISYRAMMGEYIFYYRGKIIGGIYDDRFLVKPTKSAVAMMPNADMELPYLYRLRELSLMYDGKIPLMVQERANWPKKIGRNDPCPCGSGKKYKFCHGKN